MGSAAPLVNSRGDTLTDADRTFLGGSQDRGGQYGGPYRGGLQQMNPVKASEMLLNWLTAGGPPKLLSPSEVFGESSKTSGVRAKASAGQGIGGLFGFGKMIGELTPKIEPLATGTEAIKPIKMIEPLNQSPMQTGVPYSAAPIGGK